MRIAALPAAGLLASGLLAAACASPGAAPTTTTRIRFDGPEGLADWAIRAGEWTVADGRLVGRSVTDGDPAIVETATYRAFWSDIDRVVIRGGLPSHATQNFRAAVGPVAVILNWEVARACWFNVGRIEKQVTGDALVPGREHEIVFDARDGRVRVVVDDRLLWEGEGDLHGTVTLHPCFRTTLQVREIEVTGRLVPGRTVTGPSVPVL